MRPIVLTALLLALPATARPDPAALIVAVEDYRRFPDASGAHEATRLRAPLAQAGFDVSVGRDRRLARAARDFADAAGDEGARFVLLAGRFVNDGARSWLLPETARQPDLFDTGQLLSVESVLHAAAQGTGPAVVLLAVAGADDEAAVDDRLLAQGLAEGAIPDGVSVIHGPLADVLDLAAALAAEPTADQADRLRGNAALRLRGETPSMLRLAAPEGSARATAAYERARAMDTVGAYRAFLIEYPDAAESEAARAAIARLEDTPEKRAERAEAALDLDRAARRTIQRDLTDLGHNTRGVDGIFGPGSRSAIAAWQRGEGLADTGFLTRDQITRIADQAADRRAAQRAEEARQAEARARADRAFWQETGARGDAPGLRAYLDRYPQGEHAAEAQRALERIEEDRRALERVQDDRLWQEVREADTRAGYQRYLDRYPRGAHARAARDNLRALDGLLPDPAPADPPAPAEDPQITAARQQEEAMGLDTGLRLMAEIGLGTLGFNPGPVDGRFDDATRRAIRQFQAARGLPQTGYLDNATGAQLLAGNLGQ